MTFVILLTRAILSFDLNLLIPISKVSKKPWTGGGGRGGRHSDLPVGELDSKSKGLSSSLSGSLWCDLGVDTYPQRAHPPTLLPPPEPRGINAEEKFFLGYSLK